MTSVSEVMSVVPVTGTIEVNKPLEVTPLVPVELKKAEAIERMKAIRVFPETRKQFEQEGYISISEPPFGAFYWAEGEDLEHIRHFEHRYSALVYMVVRTFFNDGETVVWNEATRTFEKKRSIITMDSYLYVSDHSEEWELDRRDLLAGEPVVYVYNKSTPQYSELGHIGIKRTPAAGFLRTY